jgi:hypothetical protein
MATMLSCLGLASLGAGEERLPPHIQGLLKQQADADRAMAARLAAARARVTAAENALVTAQDVRVPQPHPAAASAEQALADALQAQERTEVDSQVAKLGFGLSPDDVLDRIIESAKNDALLILADEWAAAFGENGFMKVLLPETIAFISTFRLDTRTTTFAHIRNAIRKDVFSLYGRLTTILALKDRQKISAALYALLGPNPGTKTDDWGRLIDEAAGVLARIAEHEHLLQAIAAIGVLLEEDFETVLSTRMAMDLSKTSSDPGRMNAFLGTLQPLSSGFRATAREQATRRRRRRSRSSSARGAWWRAPSRQRCTC